MNKLNIRTRYSNTDIYDSCSVRHFNEIKYFSRNGKSIPNGTGFQRGNFLKECRDNANNFSLLEGIHDEQYGLYDYRGGIIVFSTDVNAVRLDKNILKNKIKQIIATFSQRHFADRKLGKIINKFNRYNGGEHIGAYSIGSSFRGRYVGDNGEIYDENSTTIEVNGLSSRGLLYLAEYIARTFHQETVLVKDMNKNKIYLANGLRSNSEPDFDSINRSC